MYFLQKLNWILSTYDSFYSTSTSFSLQYHVLIRVVLLFCGFVTCHFFLSLGLCIEENNQGTISLR